jgi:AcrR family transcriptional regulator
MQDIADEADVGKGTLYEYFETKEDLFFAVYESWIHEYEMEMERQAQARLDPVSKASALIDTTVAFYERHAAHAAILLEFWAHAIRSQNAQFLNRIRQMKARLAELGGQVTRELIALKLFVDVDVDSFTRLELAMSDGVFLQWILDGQSYSLRDAYKFRQSLIGAGLMTNTSAQSCCAQDRETPQTRISAHCRFISRKAQKVRFLCSIAPSLCSDKFDRVGY